MKRKSGNTKRVPRERTTVATRSAYAAHADQYSSYANGHPEVNLYDFDPMCGRQYQYTDRIVNDLLRRELKRAVKQTTHGKTVAVLDVGCGDGWWTVRQADHLEGHGHPYRVHGLDLTPELVAQAYKNKVSYEGKYGKSLNVTFAEGDLEQPLPYQDSQFDLSTSLFTVLNHLSANGLPAAVDELYRVTRPRGRHVAILKGPGGIPTAYVASLEDARIVEQAVDHVTIADPDGTEHTVPATPLLAAQIRELFEGRGWRVADLFGIDIFMTAVLGRRRATAFARLPGEESITTPFLAAIDAANARAPQLMNYANHIAVVAERPT